MMSSTTGQTLGGRVKSGYQDVNNASYLGLDEDAEVPSNPQTEATDMNLVDRTPGGPASGR